MTKRALALLLVIAMVFSLLPVTMVSAEGEGYSVILQKAHNQTEGSLSVDVYLQANTADQGAVTGYQFTVTPGNGAQLTAAEDRIAEENIYSGANEETAEVANDYTVIYNPAGETAEPIAVDTTRVLVATLTLQAAEGAELPASLIEAAGLSAIKITLGQTGFYADEAPAEDAEDYADYKGAVTQSEVSYACTDHTCGHGTGTWTPVTAAELAGKTLASGNYYLVEDVNVTQRTQITAENAQVNICLNGYTWTCSTNQMILVNAIGATVNICDCTATGSGTGLVAGKIVPQNYNWGGGLRVSSANTTVNVSNVIVEGGENAPAYSATNTNIGNAAAFYSPAGATGSLINVENVLVRNMNAKTVVDIRAGGYFKNVVFENCSGSRNNPDDNTSNILAIFANNGAPGADAYLTIEDCRFVGCTGRVLDTEKRASTFTLKGNVQADGVFYVTQESTLNLDLGSEAKVTIETEVDKTAETFGEAVAVVDTLPENALIYANAKATVSYVDGQFRLNGHAHEDGYANIKASQEWTPWNDPTTLPSTSGYYYLTTDVTLTAEAPNTTVHICLNGHTIDASNTTRVSSVWSYTKTFCDCQGYADPEKAGTLIGGTSQTGSIFWMRGRTTTLRGSYLYLYDVKLTGSQDAYSTAIYFESSATGSSAANAILTMDRVEAYGNHAYQGGVIRLESASNKDNQAQITIRDCNFHDNTASQAGGAIYLCQNPTVSIQDTIFDNNVAAGSGSSGGGGAVYVTAAKNVSISGCTFTNNATTASSTTGGALRLSSAAAVTVSDSTFTGNRCEQSGGGAIYTVSAGTSLTLDNCKITGNTDKAGGAGVYMTTQNTTLILSGDTVIAGNTTTGSSNTIQDLFYQAGNTWTTPLMQIDELGDGAHINAYYASTTAAVNTNTTDDASGVVAIANNGTQAPFNGLISYAKDTSSGVKTVNYLDLTTDDGEDNPTFTYGHYHKNAQGGYDLLTAWTSKTALPEANPTDGNSGYYLANNVTVSAAKALTANTKLCLCMNGRTVKGGSTQAYRVTAATITGVELTLEDCTTTYDENGYYVSGGKFDGFSKAGNGCMLQFYSGDVHISGIAFTNGVDTQTNNNFNSVSSAKGYGGAVIQTRGNNNLTLNIDGCKFANNTSTSDGGAIVSMAGQHYISNTVFEGNEADRSGGAIAIIGTSSIKPSLELNNCRFEDNHAYNAGHRTSEIVAVKDSAKGGAIYTEYTDVDITGCEFIGNSVAHKDDMTADNVGRGGAIMVVYNGANGVTIADTSFVNNSAENTAGAVYMDSASVTVTNVTANGNTAGAGGVFYVNAGTDLTINGGTFTGNSTTKTGDTGGGAFRTSGATTVTVNPYEGKGAVFSGNTSAANGGAIVLATGANLRMDGAIIEDNRAANGAALTVWGTTTAALHNTTVQYNKSNSTTFGNVFFGGTGNADACRLVVSGVTVIDNNTNADGTVESNIVLRGNISPLMQIGEGGLEAGSSIGVDGHKDRFTKDYFHITGDLGDEDPTQYFSSDNSSYAIAKVNGKVPTYYASGTAKPTTHAAGTAAEEQVAAARQKVASGEYYEIFTATSSEIAADDTNAAKTYTYLTGYVEGADPAVDHLAFVSAKVGDTYYHTVSDAITAAGAEGMVVLQADVNANMNANADLKIDLNGHDIQKLTMAEGTTVYLIDSKTDDYDVADGDYGTVKVEGEGKVAPYAEFTTDAGKLRRYLVLTDGDGVTSAHRIYLAINGKVLRTTNNGVGFKAIYGGDQVVAKAIEDGTVRYGLLLTLDNKAEKNEWLYGDFSASGFTAGAYASSTPNQKTAVIVDVLVDADADDNQARADAEIYGVPCVAINNEVVAIGAEISTSLAELAKDALANGTDEIKEAVETMLNDFSIELN